MRGPSRWAALLVVLACIVVAAAGTKLSEQSSEYFDFGGRVGRPVQINDTELTVTRVQAASAFRYASSSSEADDVARTPGIFVVVDVLVAAPGKSEGINQASLESPGRTYDAYDNDSVSPDAGYQGQAQLVFEVDPRTLSGLTLNLSSSEVIHGVVDRAVIDLGITDEVADRLRQGAAQTLEVRQYPDYQVIT